jgi:hypothetical protein
MPTLTLLQKPSILRLVNRAALGSITPDLCRHVGQQPFCSASSPWALTVRNKPGVAWGSGLWGTLPSLLRRAAAGFRERRLLLPPMMARSAPSSCSPRSSNSPRSSHPSSHVGPNASSRQSTEQTWSGSGWSRDRSSCRSPSERCSNHKNVLTSAPRPAGRSGARAETPARMRLAMSEWRRRAGAAFETSRTSDLTTRGHAASRGVSRGSPR